MYLFIYTCLPWTCWGVKRERHYTSFKISLTFIEKIEASHKAKISQMLSSTSKKWQVKHSGTTQSEPKEKRWHSAQHSPTRHQQLSKPTIAIIHDKTGAGEGEIWVSIELRQLLQLVSVSLRFHSHLQAVFIHKIFYIWRIIYRQGELMYSTQHSRIIGLQSQIAYGLMIVGVNFLVYKKQRHNSIRTIFPFVSVM